MPRHRVQCVEEMRSLLWLLFVFSCVFLLVRGNGICGHFFSSICDFGGPYTLVVSVCSSVQVNEIIAFFGRSDDTNKPKH